MGDTGGCECRMPTDDVGVGGIGAAIEGRTWAGGMHKLFDGEGGRGDHPIADAEENQASGDVRLIPTLCGIYSDGAA